MSRAATSGSLCALLLLLSTALSYKVEGQLGTQQLRPADSSQTDIPSNTGFIPPVLASGGFYMQEPDAINWHPLSGEARKVFKVKQQLEVSDPTYADSRIWIVDVREIRTGEPTVLVQAVPRMSSVGVFLLATFSADGQITRLAHLDHLGFQPQRFVPFAAGSGYLVVGFGGDRVLGRVVDTSGEPLTDVRLPTFAGRSETAANKSRKGSNDGSVTFAQALQLEVANAIFIEGDDGYAYMQDQAKLGQVERIASNGKVDSIQLQRSSGPHARLLAGVEANGKLIQITAQVDHDAVGEMMKLTNYTVQEFNLIDGSAAGKYSIVGNDLCPYMASFGTPDRFYFLEAPHQGKPNFYNLTEFTP